MAGIHPLKIEKIALSLLLADGKEPLIQATGGFLRNIWRIVRYGIAGICVLMMIIAVILPIARNRDSCKRIGMEIQIVGPLKILEIPKAVEKEHSIIPDLLIRRMFRRARHIISTVGHGIDPDYMLILKIFFQHVDIHPFFAESRRVERFFEVFLR